MFSDSTEQSQPDPIQRRFGLRIFRIVSLYFLDARVAEAVNKLCF